MMTAAVTKVFDMYDAIRAYRDKDGTDKWMDNLMDDWRTGRDVNALPGDGGAYLRVARNRLGPSWLVKNFGKEE